MNLRPNSGSLKMNRNPTFRLEKVSCALAFLTLCSAHYSSGATLTGASIFHANSTGQPAGPSAWNTIAGDGLYNLWFAQGEPDVPGALTNSFLNGPNESAVAPGIFLRPGTNHLMLFA